MGSSTAAHEDSAAVAFPATAPAGNAPAVIAAMLPVDCVLALQRTVGNATVTRYMARSTAAPRADEDHARDALCRGAGRIRRKRDVLARQTGSPSPAAHAIADADAPFSWYDTPPQLNINPASSIFTAPLNEVGRTFPILNGRPTWLGDSSTAVDEIARALNPPAIERDGARVRLVEPGRNSASALIRVPGNGPWSAEIDVAYVRRFAAGTFRSSAAVRPVVPSLPRAGTITVRVRANAAFGANTLEHEREHARHIREACESQIGLFWNAAVRTLAGDWFESEAAMDARLFHEAGLAGYEGSRLIRLAKSIFAPVGLQAIYLHRVADWHQALIADVEWHADERTLVLSVVEVAQVDGAAGAPPAQGGARVDGGA